MKTRVVKNGIALFTVSVFLIGCFAYANVTASSVGQNQQTEQTCLINDKFQPDMQCSSITEGVDCLCYERGATPEMHVAQTQRCGFSIGRFIGAAIIISFVSSLFGSSED